MLVDITTTDAGTSIAFNSSPKTPDELEKLLREIVTRWGINEPIYIRPDEKTSFTVVFDILRRLKAAGVKHFEVLVPTPQVNGFHDSHSLVGTSENIRFERIEKPTFMFPKK